jgi:glycosyltransferase involved in cell wall biosynthesis
MEFGISILICCYNSAARLPETIKHLALQKVPSHIPWEVILVNNASKDNTTHVARAEWGRYNLPGVGFKILEEANPGKTYALEKGIKAAKFEYLLTCDDDNWLADNYLTNAFDIMNADPAIGALGGMGILEAEQPANLDPDELDQLTVHGPQTWASTDHWVYGAGSLYRKSLLDGLMNNGWQQITIGRTGSNLISGEDVEICFMIYLCGYKIIADDRLIFKHFVPLNKQKIAYIQDMALGLSYSYYLLYAYLVIINKEKSSLDRISYRLLISHTKTMIRQNIQLIYQRSISRKNPTLDQKKSLMANYGMICSILKNRKKVIQYNKYIREFLNNNPALTLQDKIVVQQPGSF